MYDLAIIGAGPGGYVAAEKAAKAGLKVILFEKDELGGVCLNEGCIPTKTLLYSAKLLDSARGAAKYGISFPQEPSMDFAAIMKRKEKVVKKLVGGVKVRMRNAGVETVKGCAFIEGATPEGFSLRTDSESYQSRKLLICTGSSNAVPPIPGLRDNPLALSSREILSLEEVPQSLIIIGGGVIGMEFASFFNSIGTRVSVIEMLPKILGPMEEGLSSMLMDQYSKKGIDFHLGCRVTSVSGGTVYFSHSEGKEDSISGSRILVSTGRKPNLSGYGLENLGIKCEKGITVDSHMRTNVPGVYAVGDVTALSMLAHTASRQGEVAVNDILSVEDSMTYKAIPSVVYTNPEIAGVGATEGFGTLSLPLAYSGRFVAENERGEGLCKIVLDSEDRVIGVHILGNPASEIIPVAALAIEKGLSAKEFSRLVFPHPTVSEILRETLLLSEK